MSDRTGLSNNATKGSGKQSFQSAWMAHWMKPNHIAAAEIHTSFRNEDLDYARMDASLLNKLEVPKSTKGAGVLETKSFKILNDSPRKDSKSPAKEGMHSSHLKPGKDTNEVRTFFSRDVERGKGVINNNGLLFLPMNSEIPISNGTPSGRHPSRGEGTSKNPLGWMNTHPSAIRSSFAASKPMQELLVESSSCVVPNRFDIEKCEADKAKAVAVSPLMSRSASFSNNLPDGNMGKLEQGNCHNRHESADLAYDRRMGSHSQLHNPTPAHFRENKTSLFSEAPSTSDHHLPQFNQGWFQKMNKYSSLGLFPVQCVAPEKTKAKKSHCDPYSLQKFPDCVHDVDTMRICTMVDSVVGMPGGCPMFAQTTHSLLITKKTDANLSKENETFRSTRVITKINEKTCNEPCGPSSFFDQGNRGLKLQALSSSSDSEGKGNVGGVKVVVTRRNESSAETDTLDMDSLKEKILNNGTNSTASTKGINVESYLPPWVNAASSREAMIHDINLKPPGLPVPASLSENMGPTSSRTQSLEMDMLLAHAKHPKPKFNLNLECSTKEDASNRWVKRLKLNSLSAQSTKSSNLGENVSDEKMNKCFSTILKNSFTSSEPSLSKHHGRESNKDRDLSKEDVGFPVDVAKKDAKLVLSHAWIQRWLSHESRVAQKKPVEMVACEPLSSKLELEDLKKKQFPSVAAMALMGKAMSGFQPCELHKRGSFTVWNTKTF